MPISCVALFVFFVPILLYHLPGSHSPTLGFFSPLFMGLTKAFGCQGVPFGFSTSAYSPFDAVSSQRTASAVRLVRGRDALTISDIGTISFVTCFSDEPHEQRAGHCFFTERSAFTLSHTLRATCGTLLFRLVWALTYTLLSMRTNSLLTPC